MKTLKSVPPSAFPTTLWDEGVELFLSPLDKETVSQMYPNATQCEMGGTEMDGWLEANVFRVRENYSCGLWEVDF